MTSSASARFASCLALTFALSAASLCEFSHTASAHGAFAIGGSTADSQYGFAAGYSWNHDSKEAAERKAIEQCKSYPSEAPDQTNAKCAIVANFSHQWLVIAMDPDAGQTGFGYSIGNDRDTAERNAMGQCKASSPEARRSFCAVAAAKFDEKP